MAGNPSQTKDDATITSALNEPLALRVLQEVLNCGVTEFCVCPGKRAYPLFAALQREPRVKKYFWYEERSAAFFALGRSRELRRPVAIVTTSGTAVGELLSAVMEAYYTGVPLLLLTADRPRRFRWTGAPQTAEQVGLFGVYVHHEQDLADHELCDLSGWTQEGPAHLNVCFEEPIAQAVDETPPFVISSQPYPLASKKTSWDRENGQVDHFFHQMSYPFAVVSALKKEAQEEVVKLLLTLNIPVCLEAISGLREDSRLQHLRITDTEKVWKRSSEADYPIDGVLRIGGVPTFRMWRDLEDRPQLAVCSINDVPFSGLSGRGIICAPIHQFLQQYRVPKCFFPRAAQCWWQADRERRKQLIHLFQEEPRAEPSLFYALSQHIPQNAKVYLGNSLPIREWDLAACDRSRGFNVQASRGLNGIDGQLSTFLGLCSSDDIEHWAIVGDLTALYDLAAPWIIPQLQQSRLTLVVVNNYGGQIFSPMFPEPEFCHPHQLRFSSFAALWNMDYECWREIPMHEGDTERPRLIELIPDNEATARFWKKT